jgi:hypothetical protein
MYQVVELQNVYENIGCLCILIHVGQIYVKMLYSPDH